MLNVFPKQGGWIITEAFTISQRFKTNKNLRRHNACIIRHQAVIFGIIRNAE